MKPLEYILGLFYVRGRISLNNFFLQALSNHLIQMAIGTKDLNLSLQHDITVFYLQ
jgi:hypothetical protein